MIRSLCSIFFASVLVACIVPEKDDTAFVPEPSSPKLTRAAPQLANGDMLLVEFSPEWVVDEKTRRECFVLKGRKLSIDHLLVDDVVLAETTQYSPATENSPRDEEKVPCGVWVIVSDDDAKRWKKNYLNKFDPRYMERDRLRPQAELFPEEAGEFKED